MLKNVFYVSLGGIFGVSCRYMTSVLLALKFSYLFPLSTFIVNIIGSFLIGLFYGIFVSKNTIWLIFAVGFCGGFTTFSAFSLENLVLLSEKHYTTAAFYTFFTLLFGLAGVFLGYILGLAVYNILER